MSRAPNGSRRPPGPDPARPAPTTPTTASTPTTATADTAPPADPGALVMVLIPGGQFDMGCLPEDDPADCEASELDVHSVTLTRDFWMAATEFTMAQYTAVTGLQTLPLQGCTDLTCPLGRVSWHEAAVLTNALSAAEGFEACYTCADDVCQSVADLYGCEGYRLPTEAEWEYAARCASTSEMFAGSDQPGQVAWYRGNADDLPHPVAEKQPNACALYDMSGNTEEWVNDGYESEYGLEAEVDPLVPFGAFNNVLRGGKYNSGERELRIPSRSLSMPTAGASFTVCFRPVRTVLP